MNDYHEDNRQSWNVATRQHHTHKPDLIARYKNGYNNLYPEETALLGDIRGQSLVHLQCNDGQDTVSIARHLGANVTGVDISDEAIAFAQRLSDEAGIPAQFVRADIFDWCETNSTRYDVVYTGYGALNWLSSITRWAQSVARTLAVGGRLVLIEFHPLVGMLEIDWTLKYDYLGGRHYSLGGVGDYVGNNHEGQFVNPHDSHEFAWGIGEVVSALLEAGLRLDHLQEYPFINGWQAFPDMRSAEGNRYYPPAEQPTLAMMYSVVASRTE
ncbi:MAG: class I SAM-dependent methyltransferase [Anaerolineae bacterium]